MSGARTSLVALAVVGLVMVGCVRSSPGASDETIPSSIADVAATPEISIQPSAALVSPHPVSPEQGFKEQADQGLAFHGDLTGMLVTSAQGRNIFINPVHGFVQVEGADTHLLIVGPDAAGTRVFEEVRIDGRRSVRGPDGIWRPEDPAPDRRDLLSALAAIGPIKTVGREGPHVVLAVEKPVDLGTLGGIRPGTTTANANLEILVDAAGSPCHLRFEMGPVAPGMFSAERLEIEVHPTFAPPAIAPPSPWVRYVSERGYDLLMPAACKPLEGSEDWEDFDCGGSAVRVWTHAAAGSLETWVEGSVKSWSRITDTDPDLEGTLRVGTKADGVPGQIATYRYTKDALAVVMSDGVFVHGNSGFDFVVIGDAGSETTDRARFLQMLTTWRFAQ